MHVGAPGGVLGVLRLDKGELVGHDSEFRLAPGDPTDGKHQDGKGAQNAESLRSLSGGARSCWHSRWRGRYRSWRRRWYERWRSRWCRRSQGLRARWRSAYSLCPRSFRPGSRAWRRFCLAVSAPAATAERRHVSGISIRHVVRVAALAGGRRTYSELVPELLAAACAACPRRLQRRRLAVGGARGCRGVNITTTLKLRLRSMQRRSGCRWRPTPGRGERPSGGHNGLVLPI